MTDPTPVETSPFRLEVELMPDGRLAMLLPGPHGRPRRLPMALGIAEQSLRLVLSARAQGRTSIGLAGAPTSEQLVQFERQLIATARKAIAAGADRVAVQHISLGQSGFGPKLVSNKTAEELGL